MNLKMSNKSSSQQTPKKMTVVRAALLKGSSEGTPLRLNLTLIRRGNRKITTSCLNVSSPSSLLMRRANKTLVKLQATHTHTRSQNIHRALAAATGAPWPTWPRVGGAEVHDGKVESGALLYSSFNRHLLGDQRWAGLAASLQLYQQSAQTSDWLAPDWLVSDWLASVL